MQQGMSYPPLPIAPTCSKSSSSQLDDNQQENGSSSTQSSLADVLRYISDFDRALRPRLEDYENNQREIKTIITRERIIEQSTLRLLQINFILGITLPFMLVIVFFCFCFYHAPDNVIMFFDTYKLPLSIFALACFCFIAKPLYDIHNYNKRLDAIERYLKINGN